MPTMSQLACRLRKINLTTLHKLNWDPVQRNSFCSVSRVRIPDFPIAFLHGQANKLLLKPTWETTQIYEVAARRNYSDESNSSTAAEENLIRVLSARFTSATDIAVVDVSGGCGAMYEVYVESPEFKGMRIVKQHQLVTEALKQEIGEMHGIRISTKVSEVTT